MLMVISGYTVSSKSAWAIMRSQKMEGGGIEIIIAIYTKASHGAIQCLISCCHLFPWVEKKESFTNYSQETGCTLNREIRHHTWEAQREKV